MGGRSNVWESGKDRDIGLVDAVGKTVSRKQTKFKNESNPSDDLLEFEIFSSVLHLGLVKANRVAQEKGPITIFFKEHEQLVTYFQIDGEFYKVTNPHKIVIKLSDVLGHIKILKYIENE